MPPKRSRIKKRKNRHIILVLLLVIAGVFFLIREPDKQETRKKFSSISKKPETGQVIPPGKLPSAKSLPRVSIIIDDLGPNKKMAEEALKIKAPLTLSILPQETYSVWIANEGHKLGRDIIAHIPMEATRSLKLGKGGLYTWMNAGEIIETLDEDIRSIPHVKGVSSHMGSAFTADRRSVELLVSAIKKRGLFFLDSYTTVETLGLMTAKKMGVKTDRRHVFLDNSSRPADIEAEWKRLIKLAGEQGYAIAIAHPRKNTLAFLRNILPANDDVELVPITELLK